MELVVCVILIALIRAVYDDKPGLLIGLICLWSVMSVLADMIYG